MKSILSRALRLLLAFTLILAGVWSMPAKGTFQTEVFQVPATAKIVVGTNNHATLSAVKVGDRVSIAYNVANGVFEARHIADGVPHKPRAEGVVRVRSTTATTVPRVRKPSAVSHARGIVASVDALGSTLTISTKKQ